MPSLLALACGLWVTPTIACLFTIWVIPLWNSQYSDEVVNITRFQQLISTTTCIELSHSINEYLLYLFFINIFIRISYETHFSSSTFNVVFPLSLSFVVFENDEYDICSIMIQCIRLSPNDLTTTLQKCSNESAMRFLSSILHNS